MPAFDTDSVPADPLALFVIWLHEAVAAAVDEPHAMTLSTVDEYGLPDARVVMLTDIDENGFQLATDASSTKGAQLSARPVAALSFYWREQGRQVRVRGRVAVADADTCAQDFLSRADGSRAASVVGRQSNVLDDPDDLVGELRIAHQLLLADPQAVPESHTVYIVRPISVEFWQGEHQRRHARLRYRRAGDGWTIERLWP